MINLDTRLGRMLDAGLLTATVTSKRTGHHLTVTIKCITKDEARGKWTITPFADAALRVAGEGDGGYGTERIGRVNAAGVLSVTTASPSLAYAAQAVLTAALTGVLDTDACTVVESNRCGKCGRDLTDPESIARGIGPECYRKITKSKSARAMALAEAAA